MKLPSRPIQSSRPENCIYQKIKDANRDSASLGIGTKCPPNARISRREKWQLLGITFEWRKMAVGGIKKVEGAITRCLVGQKSLEGFAIF